MRLEDQVIVVTGTGSGLGRAMASSFVDEGASVACLDINEERLTDAIDEIAEGPGEAIPIVADVGSWGDVQDAVEETIDTFGDLSVLFNNVGIRQWHLTGEGGVSVEDLEVDVWDTVLRANVRGTFLCSKAVLPTMTDRGDGRIVHLSSAQGSRGVPNKSPYVVSKSAIEGFHDTLSLELEGTGVASMTLRPGGAIKTRIKEELDVGMYEIEDPGVISEPAIRLAAGEGENGGRYLRTEEGGIDTYTRASAAAE